MGKKAEDKLDPLRPPPVYKVFLTFAPYISILEQCTVVHTTVDDLPEPVRKCTARQTLFPTRVVESGSGGGGGADHHDDDDVVINLL